MTHPTTDMIIVADSGDLPYLAGVIGAAFESLAVSRYLIPDPADRVTRPARHLLQVVEHAHQHGAVHTTADRNAVAVWFPMNSAGLPPIDREERNAIQPGR